MCVQAVERLAAKLESRQQKLAECVPELDSLSPPIGLFPYHHTLPETYSPHQFNSYMAFSNNASQDIRQPPLSAHLPLPLSLPATVCLSLYSIPVRVSVYASLFLSVSVCVLLSSCPCLCVCFSLSVRVSVCASLPVRVSVCACLMKSKELKIKISHTHSLILSLHAYSLSVCVVTLPRRAGQYSAAWITLIPNRIQRIGGCTITPRSMCV